MNLHQQHDDGLNDDHYCPSFRTYTTNLTTAAIDVMTTADDDGDDFEFGNISPGSSPVYPVFNRDLLRDLGSEETSSKEKTIELRKLFFEEDAEELKGVAPETYCLWAPKSPETASPSRCMKSSSTGSAAAARAVSKTWRLRNLLRRCKSDGKEGLMLVNDTTKVNTKEKSLPSPRPPSSPPCSPGAGRRKSYLPYKQDLLGFFGSPQTLRRINIPPF
ncbi:hypothetical protein RND81_09G205200 [Saponaria officinalis]|uniref:Uncharacterized protein n=1 Tax=Saponaria officinalis TaxID=3572 RepID=A0AAW1INX4_SAPOF